MDTSAAREVVLQHIAERRQRLIESARWARSPR